MIWLELLGLLALFGLSVAVGVRGIDRDNTVLAVIGLFGLIVTIFWAGTFT